MQPLLPVHTPPKTLEYSPSDDSPPWLIEDWPGLSAAFNLSNSHEVIDWHIALAGQGRPWLVIRRIFKLAPLWGNGTSADDLKTWTFAELAATLGVPAEHLKSDLSAAKEFWQKARMSANISRAAPSSSSSSIQNPSSSSSIQNSKSNIQNSASLEAAVKPLDTLPGFTVHQDFTDEQITSLLVPFRFQSIRSASDRLYVANRILELRKLLEDKNTRESARQLIVMELNMANHETTLHVLKSRLETLQKDSSISKDAGIEVRQIADSIASTEKVLTALSTTYRAAATELGSDEAESGELRRVAIGTVSHLTEAHRLYYETGEKTLIDGMFTAAELVWLTTPLTIRPAQYRPDVVLRMREASDSANLWGRDYKPTVIQREACRRLHKLSQMLAEETEPPAILGIDDATPTQDEQDDDLSSASQATAEPALDSPGMLPHSHTTPDSPRPEDPCMAMG
jgi:hypothetical protein